MITMSFSSTNKFEKAFTLAYVNFIAFALISSLLLIQIILNSNLNLFKEYEMQINEISETKFSQQILDFELKILNKYLKENKISKNFDFFDSDINSNKIFLENTNEKNISIAGYQLQYNENFSKPYDYLKNRLQNSSVNTIELTYSKLVTINYKIFSIQATIVYQVAPLRRVEDLLALDIKEIRIVKKDNIK